MISNISFGKKIFLSDCCVANTAKNTCEKAQIYELDCKDKSDIDEIADTDGFWFFKNIIEKHMEQKFFFQCFLPFLDNNRFFVLSNNEGKVLGMCQTHSERNKVTVDFIESRRNENYKYVGSNMLSVLGIKLAENKKKSLLIEKPLSAAITFYEKKCGFKWTERGLVLNSEGIEELKERTQHQTSSFDSLS